MGLAGVDGGKILQTHVVYFTEAIFRGIDIYGTYALLPKFPCHEILIENITGKQYYIKSYY